MKRGQLEKKSGKNADTRYLLTGRDKQGEGEGTKRREGFSGPGNITPQNAVWWVLKGGKGL